MAGNRTQHHYIALSLLAEYLSRPSHQVCSTQHIESVHGFPLTLIAG